jgi:oxygen-independent coproporphyrinogen-3 oxidase
MFDGFGLYVHIPYCRSRCPYCDFNVRAGSSWPEARYVGALVAELEHYASRPPFHEKRLETVFLGGGTPSLFSVESVDRLLAAVRRAFEVTDGAEISLEATPESVSAETLAGYRRAGVNRLSLGIESFHPHLLKRLGRLQTLPQTLEAVPVARAAGFANVSIDLMFGVPGESLDDWRADLERAIQSSPEHVSAYGLTYENGTAFFELRRTGKLVALEEDLEAAMFEEARERLAAGGYRGYEVSNFARPGFESRHNLNYWRAGAYLGLGAGAHSHEPRDGGARRWWNEKDPDAYVARAHESGEAVADRELLDRRAASGEFVFLHLRMSEGLAEAAFFSRFGTRIEDSFPETERLVADGLLERPAAGRLALSRRGLLVADAVFSHFV